MKPGNVPTDRVGPIIEQLARERWPHSGYGVLAEKVGCHESAIRLIVEQRSAGCEFNLVDNILCSLGRPDMWWGVLSDIYYSLELSGDGKEYLPDGFQRCERVACGRLFKPHRRAPKSGPHKPKFCSPKCNDSAYRTRKRGGFKRGAYGPGMHIRKMVCAQGHDLTDDNIAPRSDGKRVCLTCQRERQRLWVAAKRAKRRAASAA